MPASRQEDRVSGADRNVMPGRRKTLLLVLLVGLLACTGFAGSASAATTCNVYASPTGSDVSGAGTPSSPLGSVAGLDWALKPGQTGCLLAGIYGSISTVHNLGNTGTATGQITITAAPGQSPKIVGLVELEGSYTTLSGLTIDGSNNLYSAQRSGTNCPYPVSNGLEIDGHNDIFEDNDFFQSVPSLRGNGIGLGWNHPADNTIIRGNRIHDLGQCMAYDQMIYLAHGDGVQIYDNWMWNDPHGWGVQLYPAASNAHIHDNVIDGAGSGFVLAGGSQVSGNTIDHNIILNSTGLPDAGLPRGVGVSTCCGVGSGNSFTDNIVANNPGGIASASGITLTGNTTASPALADVASHDYRITTAAAGGWNLWDGGLGVYGATSTGTTATVTSAGSTATTTGTTTTTTPGTATTGGAPTSTPAPKPVTAPAKKAGPKRRRRAISHAHRRLVAHTARAGHRVTTAARERRRAHKA
jgi:hypothetical protein